MNFVKQYLIGLEPCHSTMNIESEGAGECLVVAKTCGCSDHGPRVSYAFVDQAHDLCFDKKDIIMAEIQACERLLKYLNNDSDRSAVEKELSELRMALDLLN